MAGDVPGGLTLEEFESLVFEVGSWIWGTLQGAFNEEATLSQIITDAGIGMIPVAGEVTAVRDLVAVSMGLCTDPKKREDKLQWILLVVLLFALIPVIGGIFKGVGRLLLKTMMETAQLTGSVRAVKLALAAKDLVAALNRWGIGGAEKWLVDLKFAVRQSEVVEKFKAFLETLSGVLERAKTWFALPEVVVQRIDWLVRALAELKAEGIRRIPESIKELDQFLREIQAYIRSGGEMTSQAITRKAVAGNPNISYADELRMLDEGAGALRSARGGYIPNSGIPEEVSNVYTREPGFPDLTAYKPGKIYPSIASFSGKIVNRELRRGEQIFRVFGPGDYTHMKWVESPGGPAGHYATAFWGLNNVPTNAEEWRQLSAVRDEWNRDGFIIIGTILDTPVPACTGVIAEQVSTEIAGQYLTGGGKQAMIAFPEAVRNALNELGNGVVATGQVATKTIGDILWQAKPTGWLDANGIHGYLTMPGPAAIQTMRLGARELSSKRPEESQNLP